MLADKQKLVKTEKFVKKYLTENVKIFKVHPAYDSALKHLQYM